MLLPLRLICPLSKVRRDGTGLIFIQYCQNSENKTLLNTKIAIPPKCWNKKLRRISDDLPAKYGKVKELNKDLQRQFRLAEDIISFGLDKHVKNPVEFASKVFKPDYDIAELDKIQLETCEKVQKINLDIYFQLDDYIKLKRRSVSPRMINVYKNLKDTLKAFEIFRQEPITFDCIDYNFYEEFVDYMRFEHIHRRKKQIIKGFKTSNIGKQIKQLRQFLKNRISKKIIAPINLEEFTSMDEESDAIYLTNNEIVKIHELDLTEQPFLEKYRDLFVVACLTGLRFSDFSLIKPEDIRGKTLYKKQQKSEHWVVIPLRDRANYILNYVFKKHIPFVNDVDFNRYIKVIGKLAGIDEIIKFSHKRANKKVEVSKPKYSWITSHTCRRSFCTNEFLAGTPVELIMKISGHKSLRDFYRYIRITPEEAAQKIREIWQKRGEIAAPAIKAVSVA